MSVLYDENGHPIYYTYSNPPHRIRAFPADQKTSANPNVREPDVQPPSEEEEFPGHLL